MIRHTFQNPDVGDLPTMIIGAIEWADLVFVWLDSLDCYGTLVEIGLARSQDKIIVIAIQDEPARLMEKYRSTGISSDLWLALRMAHKVISCGSPSDAWEALWS
jgi:hypothetical protein